MGANRETLNDQLTTARKIASDYFRYKGLRDSEDLAQEVIIHLWKAAEIEEIENLRGLTLTIASRVFADYLERTKYRDVVEVPLIEDLHSTTPISPDAKLSSMPDDVRQIAELLLLGYTQEEVARSLRISHKALEQRLLRYRRKISLTP
jgi:DNA-directed RNA polymerase specialized sigma24 family protein